MNAHFRALAAHQAHFHRTVLVSWGPSPAAEKVELLLDGLVYDGLWLTKFPLLFKPSYGVLRLDALQKAWQIGTWDAAEALALRPLVDADVFRFVLKLNEIDGEAPVEIFWGGRAMNKPLWMYLAAWFEHGAALRARLASSPGMLDTVFL